MTHYEEEEEEEEEDPEELNVAFTHRVEKLRDWVSRSPLGAAISESGDAASRIKGCGTNWK